MKFQNKRKYLPGITLVVTALAMLWITANINWGKDHWNQIVRSDGEGYYAYLPAVFIYHDLNFGFFEEIELVKYHDPANVRDYRELIDGKLVNKYFAGTALTQMPFWLAGHVAAMAGGYETDGYAKPYTISVTVAAFFYLMLGLFFLNKLLRLFDVGPVIRSLIIVACLFGTNLFYYAVGEPSVSHVYSFGLITTFCYVMKRFFDAPAGRWLPAAGILLGVIILIRPVNGLLLLSLPFIAGSRKNLTDGIRAAFRKPVWLIPSLIAALAIAGLQYIIYKLSTGSFFVYSYRQETFNFSEFHFFEFLFSYKKGYFLYTPLAFISLFGLFYVYRKSRFAFFNLAGFLLIIIYIFSSWWSWWYGGSFSSRVMVDYLAFFMLPLALAAGSISRKWLKVSYITLIFLLTIFCQIQTFQYRYHRIHWENMNKEMYWKTFLRVDQI